MNNNQDSKPFIPFKPQIENNSNQSITTNIDQEELIAKAEDIIAPKKSKAKIILTTLVSFLILVSLASTIYLVRRNQDIRKQAVYPGECCSGTTNCPVGQQCIRTSDPACSTCQSQPGNLPGCCNLDTDCAHWEKCQLDENSACTSDKSCRSTAGCKIDTDCLIGNKCVGGTCIGPGSLECSADSSGVSINNKTDKPVSGTATYFSKWCDDSNGTNCFCSGTPTSVAVTLQPGESWSRNIVGNGPPTNCAWQSDLTFPGCDNANHGCQAGCNTPTNTPTTIPTTPVISCQCGQVKAYDTSWKLLTNADLAALKAGDKVRFTVSGTATSGTIDKSRFKINGGTYLESIIKKSTTQEFYYEYTIPANVTSFSVEAQVHHAGLNQWF